VGPLKAAPSEILKMKGVMEVESQFWTAIIGAFGVIATAVISNWDKLFGPPRVRAEIIGYVPCKDYECELRHLLEVSGFRATTDAYMKARLENQRAEALRAHPDDGERIVQTFDIMSQQLFTHDDIVKAYLPIYQKYYDLGQIQELNKMYSTAMMREMTKVAPMLARDISPVQRRLEAEMDEAVQQRLEGLRARAHVA
jgi:hypothetical protein